MISPFYLCPFQIYLSEDTEINLTQLDETSLVSLKFFLGGFGDARHLYASLSDLHDQADGLPEIIQKNLKVLFCVNNIKAHPVAKIFVMLSALRKLSEYSYYEIKNEINAAR